MKKLLTAVLHSTQPISKTLLVASFGAGYILATILFTYFNAQIHHFLQSIFF